MNGDGHWRNCGRWLQPHECHCVCGYTVPPRMIVTHSPGGWTINAAFDVAQWKDETMSKVSFVAASQHFITELLDYMEEHNAFDLGLIRLWATVFFIGIGEDDDGRDYCTP